MMSSAWPRVVFLALQVAQGSPVAAGQTGSAEDIVETVVQVPAEGVTLALRDMDGDGDLDLIRVDETSLTVQTLAGDGRFSSEADASLTWPGERTAWTLDDLDADGTFEVLLLTGTGELQRRVLGQDGFEEPELLLQDSPYLPPGISAMGFTRDVDGDGRTDVVIPARGAHHVHLATAEGFAEPLVVAYDVAVTLSAGDPNRMDAYIGRTVAIPWFHLEDMNGDGLTDLVSQTRQRVAVHLGDTLGLPTSPSWKLDLAGLQSQLPRNKGVDLDDLLANIEDGVSWDVAELDGTPPRDLLIATGQKISVYLGGAESGPRETPDQLLKSSGKILAWFVRQVQGDALPELQIVRGEKLSLGRMLRYLILPGTLDFDIYTYRNEAGAFSRKPTQRGRVSVKIPRLLKLMDEAEAMGEALNEQLEIPARRITWQHQRAAGGAQDVVDVRGGEVVVYAHCAPPERRFEQYWEGSPDIVGLLEALVLEDLDALGDAGTVTIDLGELMERDFTPGAALRSAALGQPPVWSRSIEGLQEALRVALLPVPLAGGARDDLVIATLAEDTWTVRLLVRRP